jgi:hypothetical protein
MRASQDCRGGSIVSPPYPPAKRAGQMGVTAAPRLADSGRGIRGGVPHAIALAKRGRVARGQTKKGRWISSGPSLGRKRPRRAAVTQDALPHEEILGTGPHKMQGANHRLLTYLSNFLFWALAPLRPTPRAKRGGHQSRQSRNGGAFNMALVKGAQNCCNGPPATRLGPTVRTARPREERLGRHRMEAS